MTIAEVNRLARRAGMSYGRYVFMCAGLPEDEPPRGQKRCAACGRLFAITGGRSLYCSPKCRSEVRNARRRRRTLLARMR